jgi:hypothetical protein
LIVRTASCPLCEEHVPVDHLQLHLEHHTLAQWVVCVQDLRAEIHNDIHLRAIPRFAMPQA